MLVTSLNARDLPEAWWLALRAVMKNGREYTIERGSYAGQKRKELDFVVVWIAKPSTRPIIPTVPEGVIPPTDMPHVWDYFTNYIISPGIHSKNEQYTYGDDISPQFLEIIRMYQEDGFNTNQACMSIGNRDSILLKDPQCLRLIDTRVMNGKLNFFVYFRSWDLYTGFPMNLAAIQLLKEAMAEELGVEDGEILALSKGLHLYDHSWKIGMLASNLTVD